ncbi:MAG: NUDIX hydrolase [Flavobacteriaceae bacterium]|jgi:8-oxo-dGTP diphosphatase|nr:NUDIX hydrolase [Flavobacteriaceae bacterium]
MQRQKEKKFLDVSVDCVVFGYDDNDNILKVLLIEQDRLDAGILPQKALPGDHVLNDEHLHAAANRVLFELTGLDGLYLKQFHTFGDPERVKYPKDQLWLHRIRKHPEARIITVGYYSLVRMEDYLLEPSSFAENAEWIGIHEIPELAFDHNRIIERGLTELRKDTESNHISVQLLPKKFTLVQLQKLYEIILEKELDKRNFRKSIKRSDEFVALDEKQKGVLHKPAQLYTFKRQK